VTGVIVTREKVRQRTGTGYVLEGLSPDGVTLAEVRDEIAELIKLHGEQAILTTEVCGGCDNCNSDLDDVELLSLLWVERDETDAELFARQTREARLAAEDERRARADFERLRSRFEPEVKP
jgi:hypothetical protein